jgi:hypothetical protein
MYIHILCIWFGVWGYTYLSMCPIMLYTWSCVLYVFAVTHPCYFTHISQLILITLFLYFNGEVNTVIFVLVSYYKSWDQRVWHSVSIPVSCSGDPRFQVHSGYPVFWLKLPYFSQPLKVLRKQWYITVGQKHFFVSFLINRSMITLSFSTTITCRLIKYVQ